MSNKLSNKLLRNYLRGLVGRFFKILPMKEENEETLPVYLKSLQTELIGFKELVKALKYDSDYVTLLAVLQFMIDNPDCPVDDIRREVFSAISICYKLRSNHTKGGAADGYLDDIRSSNRNSRQNS